MNEKETHNGRSFRTVTACREVRLIVYVVVDYQIEADPIVAVFSTREKAEWFVEQAKIHTPDKYDALYIEPWPVDTL